MAYHTHRCLKSIMAFGIILLCASPAISADARKGADIANPFPRTVLDHNVFTVFRSVNLLGYVFRDDKREILGPRFWEGKEIQTSMGDKEVSADFKDEQKVLIQELFPGVSFKKGNRTEAVYRVALKGVKVRTLSKPVLQNEYRDLPDIGERGFITSVLSAEEVVMQVLHRTEAGVQAADEKSFKGVLEGKYHYSKEHGGVVAAKNAVIGYVLSRPTMEDISRQSESPRELRTLAVFPLEFKGGNEKLRFMGEYFKNILEESMIGIPDIVIDSDRPDETKYHLKGSILEAGDKIQLELTLFNTYSQKQAAKISRLTRLDQVNLADALSEAVIVLAEGLKIELREKDLWRQQHVGRMAEGFEMMQAFNIADRLKKKNNQRELEKVLNAAIKKYPENIYLLRKLGDAYYDSSQYRSALQIYLKGENLCEKQRHPDLGFLRLDAGKTYLDLDMPKKAVGLIYSGEARLFLDYEKRELPWMNIAKIILSVGDMEGAEEFVSKTGAKVTRLEYENRGKVKRVHPFTAIGRIQLGRYTVQQARQRVSLRDVKNAIEDYKIAMFFYHDAIQILMNRYGLDSWRLVPAIEGLYIVYAETGQFTDSLTLAGHCLRLVELKHGKESVEAAVQRAHTAAIYNLTGMNERALEHVTTAIKTLKKKRKGEKFSEFATVYDYLGRIYGDLKNPRQSELYYKKSLAIYETIKGKNSVNVKKIIESLAKLELNRGNAKAASAYWRRIGYTDRQIREKLGKAAR